MIPITQRKAAELKVLLVGKGFMCHFRKLKWSLNEETGHNTVFLCHCSPWMEWL